jgi:hypothetical protein
MLLTAGILGAILTANVATGATAFRAYTASLNAMAHTSKSIPAFARKYGLRCRVVPLRIRVHPVRQPREQPVAAPAFLLVTGVAILAYRKRH